MAIETTKKPVANFRFFIFPINTTIIGKNKYAPNSALTDQEGPFSEGVPNHAWTPKRFWKNDLIDKLDADS